MPPLFLFSKDTTDQQNSFSDNGSSKINRAAIHQKGLTFQLLLIIQYFVWLLFKSAILQVASSESPAKEG